MPRRVCLFTDSREPSGLGEHMLALAAELAGDWDVAIVCPPTRAGLSLLARAREVGLLAQPLDVRDTSSEGDLVAWLRARPVDVFHAHAGIGWEGHHGICAARAAGVPVVARTEHLPNLLTDPRERADHARVVELVDRVICVSEGVRASFAGSGIPASKLSAIPNGIRPRRPRPDRLGLRRQLGLHPSARIALTVGRLVEQKGFDLLLRAAPRIVAEQPDSVLAWIGVGPLEDQLRAAVGALGLEGRVRFLGRRRDVPALLAASDVLVLPSRFEGLPLAALEAMAAGLPVVGTRVCGTSEVVVDGETGRLVEPGDAVGLAEAVVSALGDPERAARWGQAGRRRAARLFGASRMAARTAAVYDEELRAPSLVDAEAEAAVASAGAGSRSIAWRSPAALPRRATRSGGAGAAR